MKISNPYKKELNQFFNLDHNLWVPERDQSPSIFNFIGTDSESNFQKNYSNKQYRKYLEYYISNPIEYRLNSQSFRNKFDFKVDKSKKVDLYLGCSYTLGMGLHEEHTYPYILSNLTGNQFVNLGAGGYGIEQSYNNLKRFIDYYDVQNIFHFQPLYARNNAITIKQKGKWINDIIHLPRDIEHNYYFRSGLNSPTVNTDYLKEVMIDWRFIMQTYSRNLDAIKALCMERGLKYYYLHKYPSSRVTSFIGNWHQLKKGDILARDLMHASYFNNKDLADKFQCLRLEYDTFVELDIDVDISE